MKQYDNIKTRSKEKIDAIRKPKTGGGPQIVLTASQQLFAETHGRGPNIMGLPMGHDTEDEGIEKPTCSDVEEVSQILSEDQHGENKVRAFTGSDTVSNTDNLSENKQARTTKRKTKSGSRENLDEEDLRHELARIKAEHELIEKQREVAEA